ncbi:MAG: T9SS type A sorting domain-containing protein [Flavobacteriales bacterium]|nr:T9SS type A sorting domain-containing protein [Flavobacteriales bacterium]MEB2341398.1 T9SS type A sorting domain-containing protein [Flavobacteriia bacterium]
MRFSSSLLLSLVTSLACAQSWELTTPIKTRSEFFAMEMLDDDTAFAVDKPMGAILRTTDGGVNWERRIVNSFNKPMALWMWDGQRGIAVCEGGRIMRSTDGFASATTTSHLGYGSFQCVFFLNDTLGWLGSDTGKILRSTDGGENWAAMQSGQSTYNYITAIQFLDSDTGYASCYGGKMLKSTDGGLTWQGIGPFDQLVLMHDFHFYDAQEGVAVGSGGEVIRTTDGGTTWDSIPSPTTYTMLDLAVRGDVVVACGNWGRVMRSTDRGQTWTVAQVGSTDHQSIALSAGGRGILGTDGRIQCSSDMGLTWAVTNEGTWHTVLNKVAFQNDQVGVAVGYQTTGGMESGLLRTTDGGRHWSKAGGGGLGIHLTPSGAGCLGGGSGAFATTTDAFANRTPRTGPNVAIRCTWSMDANIHFVGGGAVNGGIYRTANGGAIWTRVLDVGNITISDLWFVNDQQGYAVGEYGDDYRTTDGGLTWQEMTATNGGHTVFFLNDTLGWTRSFRTTDGGDTWTYMGGTPQGTVSIFFTNPDTGYAVDIGGQTEMSTDGGQSWSTLLPGIFNAQIMDAAYVDGAIVAVGRWGDIYRAQVACPQSTTTPVITALGDSLCTDLYGTAQWYLDGDPLPEGTSPCIEAPEEGSYTVVVTDALGCVSPISAPYVVIHTSMAEPGAAQFRVHPNPAKDRLTVERMDRNSVSFAVLDAQGRTVLTGLITGPKAGVELGSLRPGVYLLRLADGRTARFVRE